MNETGAAKVTFTFLTHFGQNMRAKSMLSFKAARRFAKALGSAFLGFHLRHNASYIYIYNTPASSQFNDVSGLTGQLVKAQYIDS